MKWIFQLLSGTISLVKNSSSKSGFLFLFCSLGELTLMKKCTVFKAAQGKFVVYIPREQRDVTELDIPYTYLYKLMVTVWGSAFGSCLF